MDKEHQDGDPVQNFTITQPALRISAQFDNNTLTGVDVDVNDDPAGAATSVVNPQYIGDVLAAVLRAATPLSRLRLTEPAPRMAAPAPVRPFHEGGLVR